MPGMAKPGFPIALPLGSSECICSAGLTTPIPLHCKEESTKGPGSTLACLAQGESIGLRTKGLQVQFLT